MLVRQAPGRSQVVIAQIYHQYVRLRKDFGRYPVFVDEGAEVSLTVVCSADSYLCNTLEAHMHHLSLLVSDAG